MYGYQDQIWWNFHPPKLEQPFLVKFPLVPYASLVHSSIKLELRKCKLCKESAQFPHNEKQFTRVGCFCWRKSIAVDKIPKKWFSIPSATYTIISLVKPSKLDFSRFNNRVCVLSRRSFINFRTKTSRRILIFETNKGKLARFWRLLKFTSGRFFLLTRDLILLTNRKTRESRKIVIGHNKRYGTSWRKRLFIVIEWKLLKQKRRANLWLKYNWRETDDRHLPT